jgi:hypothetical protein
VSLPPCAEADGDQLPVRLHDDITATFAVRIAVLALVEGGPHLCYT